MPNEPREYTGRIFWYAPLQCWETPSADIAAFVGAEEHNLITTCHLERKARKAAGAKPDEAILWRTAREYSPPGRTRKVVPLGIFGAGIRYLTESMLRPYQEFREIQAVLDRADASGAPPSQTDAHGGEPAHETKSESKEIEPVPMNGELRIRDYDLGVRLGYGQPRDIRPLIARHHAALLRMGPLPEIEEVAANGAIVLAAYPNRRQAIYITAKSDTEVATDVTIEIIRKFDLYEKGEVPGAGFNSKDLGEAISTELRPIMTELGAMKDQNATLIALATAQSGGIQVLQDMVAEVVQLQTKRRTKWSDVVTALTPVITRCSEVGSAKSMQVALNQFTPVVGNMVGNAAWAAAEALHEGTVLQKIAERKARRKTRRGEAQTAPSEADDGPDMEFDFDG